MDTALFLFGMKLHSQIGSIEFYDADFANTIQVSSSNFTDKSLLDCQKIINETLRLSGFSGELLEIGKLNNIEDFNLSSIVVRKGLKISLRFNTFIESLHAFKCLSNAKF